MEKQPKRVTKEELHKIIEELPYEEFFIMDYEEKTGVSNAGKFVKKKKTKQYVDNAKVIIMIDSKPVRRVDLKGNFAKFPNINREHIIKSILIPQLE